MFGHYSGIGPGYAPLNSGDPFQQWSPYQGMPFGILGQMGAQMVVDPWMAQMGMTPMGMNSAQNMYDRMRQQNLTRHYNNVTKKNLQGDINSTKQVVEGIRRAVAGGTPMTEADKQAAQQILESVDKFGEAAFPVISQLAPDLMDRLGGSVGSSTVQAGRVALGSRYRIDPLTGRFGMSEESAAKLSESMFNDLSADPAGRAAMRGFRAGEIGQMYDSFARRGMLPGISSPRRGLELLQNENKAALDQAMRNANIDPNKDVKDLSRSEIDSIMSQDSVKANIRDIDTSRIKSQLKKYSGALAAMKEIFAANGNTGASIEEIMNGLEQLTNGTMSQIAPGRAEMLVRNMNNLAESSGMGLQGAMMLSQQASISAQAMGLNPIFGPQAAMGAMTYSIAHGSTGGSSYSTWGLSNATQLTMKDANLRVAAAGSQMANQMGYLMRMAANGTEFGGKSAALLDALRSGNYVEGMNMNQREFVEQLVKDSGGTLTGSQVSLGLEARDINQEAISNNNAQDVIRLGQGKEDVFPAVGEAMAEGAAGSLGITDEGTLFSLEKALTETVAGMDKETRGTKGLRNATLAKVLKEKLSKDPNVIKQLEGKSEEQQKQFWLNQAESVYDYADTEMRPMFGDSLEDTLALHDKETMQASKDASLTAAGKSIIQSSLSGIGTGDMLTKLMDALKTIDFSTDPDAAKKLSSIVLGGVDNEELKAQLESGLSNITDAQSNLAKLREKYSDDMGEARFSNDPEKEKRIREQYVKDLEQQENVLEGAKQEVADFLKNNEEARKAMEEARKKQEAEEAEKKKQEAEKGGAAAGAAKDGKNAAGTAAPTEMTLKGELTIIEPDGTRREAEVKASGVPADGTHT